MDRLKALQDNRARYHFQDLVEAYSKYEIYTEDKEVTIDMNNGGRPVEKVTKRQIEGALVAKEQRVSYDIGGYHIENQIRLYTYDKLQDKATIIVDDKDRYTAHLAADYSKFDTHGDGLRIYRLESDSR